MSIIDDPNADARSLMNRAPCVCDGERDGIPCRHYWSVIQKFKAANADALRSGEKNRACMLTAGLVLEFTEEEKPTYCNHYTPRPAPGLVAIVKRKVRALAGLPPKAGEGYVAVDEQFTKFRPMTPEEIAALQKAHPDRPVAYQYGQNPMSMTPEDIAKGPQINILKPGEKPPGTELSPEVEAGLDGIFKPSKFDDTKGDH